MALDMFIDITGPVVKGESKDDAMKDKVDVLAWSWGLSNAGTFHQGGGGGAGKANFQDLSFTKYIDMASAPLQLACANGTHFKQVVLTVRKAGEGQQPYLIITMDKVLVTSVSTGGSGGEDRLTENVTLNFAQVKVGYALQGDTGSTTTGPEYTYNIEGNKAA